LIILIQLILVE